MTMPGIIDGLPFVAFGEALTGIPHVMVDALRTPDTVLEISHWPGNRTPSCFKSDVSTQGVLALLEDANGHSYLADARAVSCDHFDIDGLLSIWALTDPPGARKRGTLAAQTAIVGDFDRFVSDAAVRACFALEAAADVVASSVAYANTVTHTQTATAFLFGEVLAVVAECLDDSDHGRPAWDEEYHQVLASMRYLDSHSDAIEELPGVDLAVVGPPKHSSGLGNELHRYAINAHTELLTVATTTTDNRHRLHFRYESFVDLQSRSTGPRLRGDKLAELLNEKETAGTWWCEPADTATPCLQLFAAGETPASSSLSYDDFIDAVCDFAQAARHDQKLRWHPDDSWIRTTPVPPPSGGWLR